MADFDAWEDPHCLSPLQPKPTSRRGYLFCSGFLFRLLLIALFLSVLPLLPSHPPDFVSGTVFSKCWELLRLFIIGILVSYGLFGRRRSRIPTSIPFSPAINPPNVLHASSIFSFEHPNPYPNGFDPTAVVRPGTFEFDCEPLDLPVRSLRSRVEESDSDEERASEFELLEADGSSSCCSEEDMAGSSPAPWDWPNRSSSGDSGPSLSNQSSPLRSSSSMERGNFWREDVEVESSSKSLPMMADPLSESNSSETEVFPPPPSLKSRSIRVNSMENVGVASLHVDTNLMERGHFWRERVEMETSSKSPPMMADPKEGFRPSLSESTPMEVENSRETELFASPPSLKSRSMRVNFMENVGVASLHADTNLMERGHFWRERVEMETSSKSIPMMADHKDDFRPSLSESPPMEVENSRETERFASSPSLKSRSMKVNFMENVGVADTNFMPPPSSGRRDSWREDEVVESSWSGPVIQENVFVSQPTPSKSLPMVVDPNEEVANVSIRSFRPSSSKGSSPFRSSAAESPPIEVENSRMVDFKEQIGDASLHEDTELVPPLCSAVSESPSFETEIPQREDEKRQHSQSFRSPMCNLIPPCLSESSPLCSPASESPTTEMLIPQKESKEVDTSWKDNDSSPRRVGSRRRRSRKRGHLRKDVKGMMKSRTDSLRSESSCDTPSSQSLSSSSHDFASTIEPKSSRSPLNGTSKEMLSTEMEDFECESIPYKAASPISASTQASGAHLGASSSLSKLERGTKTLSRTSHSRRFSCSSFFDRDLWKGSRDETKEINKKGKNAEASRSGKCGWDCLKLDVEPTLTNKSSTRGKSVRTVRPPAITSEPSCTNDNASLERVRERQDVVIISIGISGKNARNAPPLAERSNDKNHEGRKHERGESSSLELDMNKESSDGKTCATKYLNEDEDGNSEIDRKADEFIAKFKEQIRQQKLASRRESSKHRT